MGFELTGGLAVPYFVDRLSISIFLIFMRTGFWRRLANCLWAADRHFLLRSIREVLYWTGVFGVRIGHVLDRVSGTGCVCLRWQRFGRLFGLSRAGAV